MRSLVQQERDILTRYDGVSEISISEKHGLRRAHIHPNLPLLAGQGIMNIREYVRLDVLDRYNRDLLPEEKITNFTLSKESLSAFEQSSGEKPQGGQPVESREYALIVSFLQYLERSEIHPDDHLDIDLALTSLEKVQLFVFIESAFGVELSERELIAHFSVESLARYLSQKSSRQSEQLPEKAESEAMSWGKILCDYGSLELPESRLMHNLVLLSTGTFARSWFRLDVSGQENLPESPMIIASNHQCFFDGFIMGHFLPYRFMKNSYVLAEEKHFNTPFTRFIARTSNVIIVNRNRDLKGSLQKMAAVLQKGSNLFIFPEGTRSKDGRLGPFKETFAILSRELDVPIVPTVIQGGFDAMPSGSSFPKPFKHIRVSFLPSIYPENYRYAEISEQARRKIQGELAASPNAL